MTITRERERTPSLVTVTVNGPVPPQPQALRAANTPLGHARLARGWSQDKTVRALRLLAENWGWQIAAETSLKVQLSRWEHESGRPSEMYQVLLCALYRATPDELGFRRTPVTVKALQNRIDDLEALVCTLTAEREAQA
ncbi:hypothetical protein C9F11_15065 [Streptomyces sp. YIM 121038]|uniref:XRE family transcriptional regulator n=1 Tax=Streptomyces sp. YIM 121038 TaxID=2136401 RepID=UPI0011622BD2|nr:XRE family transcriptional regulator [Streptomyces sp. YIM 121038]QCX76682.1 hypothetical protein C9F11_15065 [Streptomyces sp. YIM 121038]